jgi:hypothetical protein
MAKVLKNEGGKKFGNRSTSEIIILMFTFTVCLSLIGSGISITIFIFINPEHDISNSINRLYQTIDIIIGALLGYTTGRAVKDSGGSGPTTST